MRALTAAMLALLALGAPALAQQQRPATCARDLFQNEAGLRREQSRLTDAANAPQAEQCRVWREHVRFLQGARSVFATCQTGAEREAGVAEMDGRLADYRVLLRDRCGRP